MALIDSALARPALPLVRPQASRAATPDGDDRSSETTAPRSGRKTALMQAIELNDDLSGLVSSMRRSRAREDGSGELRGHAWLEHVLDPKGPEKLAALRQQLRSSSGLDMAGLRALLQQAFPEPGDALAVLRTLLSDAELDDLHAELRKLHDALSSGAEGSQARAGLNIALKARLHAPRLRTSAHQLRRSYCDFLGGGDPLDAYELWMDLYGFEHRARVVEFMELAVAADMYALDPSCSRLEFGQLLQRVRQLTTLRSADHLLMRHCWHAATMQRLGVTQAALAFGLYAMVRGGGGLRTLFDSVLDAASHLMDISERVCFAQGIRRFLKALPHSLWADVGLQVQALDEVDELLDAAFAIERRQLVTPRWVVA